MQRLAQFDVRRQFLSPKAKLPAQILIGERNGIDAAGLVRISADAYSSFALDQADGTDADMRPYLEQLLDRIERSAVPPHVSLYREIDPIRMPRDTAVAIGLYVNEAISISLKYAFPGNRLGKIACSFRPDPIAGV